jgi:DNA polymerase-3 subunit beta
MLKLAAKKDVRYYLNGVLVERRGYDVFIVATDGHVLGALHSQRDKQADAGGDASLIIPREVIEGIDKRGMPDAILSQDGEDSWRLVTSVKTIPFTPIKGEFPRWRDAIPKHAQMGAPDQFDPRLLVMFDDVARILKRPPWGPCVNLAFNGAGRAARVHIQGEPEFVGVVMPFRGPWDQALPTWADD